jgi:uncharacterized protein YuzE
VIIEYDPQADALYAQLREGEIAETLETNKYIYTDVDQEGQPLGIEILFVTRHVAPEELDSITFNVLGEARQVTSLLREDQVTYDTDHDQARTSLKPMRHLETVSFLVPASRQAPIEEFVEFWIPHYRQTKYPEHQYRENVQVEHLKEENLKKLFEWKLGREVETTARSFRQAIDNARRRIGVLNDFKQHRLTAEEFLQFLSDEITTGRVYRPFFFHICRPFEFALYDQHTYRSWQFLTYSEIRELPDDFEAYKQYNRFFLGQAQRLDAPDQWEARRRLDKALMAFGEFLKRNAQVIQSKEIKL